jgi:glycosyltransferase involved in cell wall biosynthesis
MMGISVIINTLNEESTIADCIRSVQGIADELIVCDMHSEDNTVNIAREFGARIVQIERMEGAYQRMRFLGIQASSHEWVLFIDADERMTESCKSYLKELAKNPTVDIVKIWSLYWYFGDWVINGGFFGTNPRFFRKKVFLSRYREDAVQAHADWAVLDGLPNTITLPKQYYLLHYAYPTIEKFAIKTIGIYARIEAEQRLKRNEVFSLKKMLSEPIKVFIRKYLFQKGYRDGIRGFILAALYSVFRFCMHANLWFYQHAASGTPTDRKPPVSAININK